MSAASSNPLRQALWPLGLLYGTVAAVRNGLFAAGWKRVQKVPATVVSIGNLAVGGTGKTPTVAWLCELAKQLGRKPGVLARGYGRAPGAELNDEGVLLQRRMPWLLQQQDPDRVAAGKRLVGHGADYIVLDDGFQHRRLHRDRDVVCLDATLPFGNGMCLPAGDLREWRSGLRRADVILLTRAGRLNEDQRLQRMTRLMQMVGREVPIYCCDHAPRDVVRRPDGEVQQLSSLRGRRVVLWSAIAKPDGFRETATKLGCEVVGEQVHRDHHRFTADDVAAAVQKAKAADAELLTTEKDDARLDAFEVERLVLRIDLRFLDAAPLPGEFLL